VPVETRGIVTTDLRRESGNSRELEDARRRVDELNRENERLKKELLMASLARQPEPPEVAAAAAATPEPEEPADPATKNFKATDWFRRGYSAAVAGDYREAIESYNRAITMNPGFTEAYYVRGVAYNNLAQPQQAIEDLDKAISLDKGFASAYYQRGLALNKLGSAEAAAESLRTSARLGFKAAQDLLKQKGMSW
jgi:tetratricopeptide (TPR) repeat protein